MDNLLRGYMNVVIDSDETGKISTGWMMLLILHYFVISLVLIKLYQHDIDADGISYISLAQKYLSGNYSEAMNREFLP
jgi:hypothetical protein